MPRIAVALEYDGSGFAGWQSQAHAPSVQDAAQAALAAVAAEPVQLVCAGRTDAGVHAAGQVAHFDTGAVRSERAWMLGANSHLPPTVSVAWARVVPAHFHARHSAEARTYCYIILNRPARSALAGGRATLIHGTLDEARMSEAAALLLGEHDFSAFRAAECQSRTPVRHLTELVVRREADRIVIRATANAFLHHMVRNLAGALIAVGQGKAPPGWVRELLESRDRRRGAPTAPAQGLYFWQVHYPTAFALPGPPAASDPSSAMMPHCLAAHG